jgi:CCR4-NOT transcriptional regulation complex NOT5 subunit
MESTASPVVVSSPPPTTTAVAPAAVPAVASISASTTTATTDGAPQQSSSTTTAADNVTVEAPKVPKSLSEATLENISRRLQYLEEKLAKVVEIESQVKPEQVNSLPIKKLRLYHSKNVIETGIVDLQSVKQDVQKLIEFVRRNASVRV